LASRNLAASTFRRDHAFLDQLVRVVALEHAGLRHLALRAKHEAHFTGFELDRAALLPRLVEDPVQLVQALHLRQQRTDERQRLRLVLLGDAVADRVPHLRIGQARMRVHHRLIELRAADLAVAIDLHVADKAQAIHLRHQRADAVRQGLRQHRHHETGEVHRGRTQLRFVVQRRAGADVVRDVGDRDHKAEAVAVRLAVHRVIEILGVLAVDRHQRQCAQIHARRGGRGIDLQRHCSGFVERRLRKFMRDLVAVDRGLDRERCGQLVAEDGQHAADRRAVVRPAPA
jgi:hypothetical protein